MIIPRRHDGSIPFCTLGKTTRRLLFLPSKLQAQGAQFLFYVTFFAIVLTYYGLPINLFREVYVSFQKLRQRLLAFASYRRLMASMDRFDSVATEEELEEAGRVCIICRDEMTLQGSKRLPGCGHVFHKSCLREWLVQQQTCPTCRGDITAMEARQRQQQRLEQAAQEREEQEQAQAAAAAAEPPAPTAAPTVSTGPAAERNTRTTTGTDHHICVSEKDGTHSNFCICLSEPLSCRVGTRSECVERGWNRAPHRSMRCGNSLYRVTVDEFQWDKWNDASYA